MPHTPNYSRLHITTIYKLSDAKKITDDFFFRYDYLRIYDGDKKSADLLAALTGNKLLNQIGTSIFTSTGSTITVELQSDGSSLEGFKGFNLEYRAGMNALLKIFI